MTSITNPLYADDLVTIYHADCRDLLGYLSADVMVTDPPYGIDYHTGHAVSLPASIEGDEDTRLRDEALHLWGERPALVFGSWKRPRPAGTRALLVWDTLGALGMGDLRIPWKPSHQEIYVLGHGFTGRRESDVLRFAPVQSMARNGRKHPHEKPVALLRYLIGRCPPGIIVDPFMGSGSTLEAAKHVGRKAIGVELDGAYCQAAVDRLKQGILPLPEQGAQGKDMA